MYDGPTLAKLPTDNRWVFRTADLAVLGTNDSPTRIHIHGAVKKANIFEVGEGGVPSVDLWMWSVRDSEVAMKLFGPSAAGECRVRVSSTHSENNGAQRMYLPRCCSSQSVLLRTQMKRYEVLRRLGL